MKITKFLVIGFFAVSLFAYSGFENESIVVKNTDGESQQEVPVED